MAWLVGGRYADWIIGIASQTIVGWSTKCPACPPPPACPACPQGAPVHVYPPAACPAAAAGPEPAASPASASAEPRGDGWSSGWLARVLLVVKLLAFAGHLVRFFTAIVLQLRPQRAPAALKDVAGASSVGAPTVGLGQGTVRSPIDARWPSHRVLISTPDGDVYAELYDLTDGSLAAVRFEDDRRTRPPGLGAGGLYRFRRALTVAEETAIQAELEGYAQDVYLATERAAGRPALVPPVGAMVYFTFGGAPAVGGAAAPGGGPACPPAAGAPVAAAQVAVPAPGPPGAAAPAPVTLLGPAGPVVSLAADAPGGAAPLAAGAVPGPDGQWVYIEMTTAAARGDAAVLDGSEVARGDIGLKQAADGSWTAIRRITSSQVAFRGGR
ncbi:unnamed protein product, partial [Prorocentrum cordatum]